MVAALISIEAAVNSKQAAYFFNVGWMYYHGLGGCLLILQRPFFILKQQVDRTMTWLCFTGGASETGAGSGSRSAGTERMRQALLRVIPAVPTR